MRGPGEILLLSCYELGHQPLGLAVPAAFLERAGFAPRTLDLSLERLEPEAVARARLVAISVPMHTALRLGVRAADEVRRRNPAAHLCFHGSYATLNQAHLVARHGDSVLGGEVEEALVRLAEALEAGRPIDPRPPPVRARLDFVLPSRRSLPPLDRYARLEVDGTTRLAGAIEATRGCKHTCRHCPLTPVYQGRFFAVPRDLVLADAEQQIAAGASHLTFADPDFLNGPRHAIELARELHRRHPHVSFDATIKVEHLLQQPRLVEELGRLGGLFVVSAFESVNDRVLEALAKGHTAGDLPRALEIVRASGMSLRPTFVAFSPWETVESRLALFEFVLREGLVESIDPVQYTLRLLIPPGSSLVELESMRPHLGALEPVEFGHRWTHPDPRMDELAAASAKLVHDATARGEPAATIFDRLHAQTRALAGEGEAPAYRSVPRPPVPRLSESWFC